MNHKSGFVAILGLPNSGKSTLLNAILGQKLSIINNKPQTTRKKIQGILNSENYQVIFLDTAGIPSTGFDAEAAPGRPLCSGPGPATDLVHPE